MVPKNTAILVTGYRRPQHLDLCLKNLAQSPIFNSFPTIISIDGPSSKDDEVPCQEARSTAIFFAQRHRNVNLEFSNVNKGLGESILSAVDQVFENFNSIIVIEDDLLLSPFALEYFEWGLRSYENQHRVGSISGFSLPLSEQTSDYFIRGADCWGWATWRNRWNDFERDGRVLLNELKKRRLQRAFDLDYSYQYTHMLERQVRGLTNSWAIRWHANNFLKGRFTLCPKESLVLNIGGDGSGTNMGVTSHYRTELSVRRPDLKFIEPKEDCAARSKLISFYSEKFRPRTRTRVHNWFSRLVYKDSYIEAN